MDPKLRQRALSDWLGMTAPEKTEPSDLRKIYQKAFNRLGLADRLQESTLQEAWPNLLGPSLATHCRPGVVRRGKLTVYVDHPAWLHQITMVHKTNILQAVQKHFAHLKIQEIALKIGR
jgi:predicted nucleic acid-binding Zn ribbon protein